ncbi:hypothetical protein [Xenophilus sp. Marseille-Q4582]|uniref:hypothetical protein n=1 Tax=Xenophilus sp. Marseille-Q4582 TaxID=2866600 RepID=UPI001CE46A1A|nr:hypothetical protein [Xenophilus sp. Marseille-Q4582]
MSDEAKINAAAELADRYIEIILSTKPELLVYGVAGAKLEEIPRYAQKLTDFRQQVINNLLQQPLPDLPEDD